jgi:hypothetical protein
VRGRAWCTSMLRTAGHVHTTPHTLSKIYDSVNAGVNSETDHLATGLSRDGDGLGRPIYVPGSRLSWNPIAAAFRSSTFNALAFILAS